MKNGQMLLKHLSWIGKIVKIYEMLLKNYIFGRSVKNFRTPGQFLKVWNKLEMSGKKFWKKCIENPGGQKFWQRGGGEIS